jgi:hypothetical protein
MITKASDQNNHRRSVVDPDPTLFAGSEYRHESGKIIPVPDSSGSEMNSK